jgi:hypothetical protein
MTEGGYKTIGTDHTVREGIDERIVLTLSSYGKVIHEVALHWNWGRDQKFRESA